MIRYIAVIDKDPDSDFGVYFPDLPGCVSAGSSLDEAWSMAAEALELHLEGMTEDGEPLPEPTARHLVEADPENEGALEFVWVEVKSVLAETA